MVVAGAGILDLTADLVGAVAGAEAGAVAACLESN